MNQDPKPTTPPLPGALGQALADALKKGAEKRPVEQARTTIVMPNEYVVKPSKESK